MNCRNAFQINMYFENCMTNRASLKVTKKKKYLQKKLRGFDVLLTGFFKLINQPYKLFGCVG